MYRTPLALGIVALTVAAGTVAADTPAPVEFNRHVRPILSDKCFTCHGPDNNLRKGDLRLDVDAGLYDDRGGYKIVVPGRPEKSELIRRVTSHEPGDLMPPRKTNKTVTKEEVAVLRAWVEQGGKYQGHWAFLQPQRHPLPEVKNAGWVRNAIDRFVLARLEKEGRTPSPEADRRTLVRRLTFDLTGLPPTPERVEAYIKDDSPRAYENLVDDLLRSPHFGERMAVHWLDVVRYADTGGYHSDNHRDLWLYREYVIDAFNKNVPFDRFVTEQLAGDLLPDAGVTQRIASGFNRLLQTTEEGGAQPKEYAAKYQADRVRNTGSIFLGLTTGCAECHDHKFDPFTTKQFYEFAAFFADLQERPVGRQEQTPFPTPEQQQKIREITEQVAAVQKALADKAKGLADERAKWEEDIRNARYKNVPANVAAALKVPAEKRNAAQQQVVEEQFRKSAPQLQAEQQRLTELEARRKALTDAVPTSLVSLSGPPRPVRILPRGNWLDDSGEIVQPDVPDAILPLPAKKERPTRLDLARWVTDPDNPLTSRVFVNRIWMLFFGQGIVKTPYDFGSQGAWPTHPELLDWLSVEFRESGWDVRHLVRLMVTSATYRQSSAAPEAARKADPYNESLGRQGRWRLDAEFVRDNALSVSGLLSRKVGGPSVKPYQPDGYWEFLNFPRRTWVADKGEDQYRRGLYTYWQRTFLHPSLLAFDAPSREECTAQRARSNTPQQALVLLNDPTYVEAARVLAEKAVRAGDADDRIAFACRQVLQRPPEPAEAKILQALYAKHLAEYRLNPQAARDLLAVGQAPQPADLPAGELAATTSVTRALLNLHETITRE